MDDEDDEDWCVAVRVGLRLKDWDRIDSLRGPSAKARLAWLIGEYQARADWKEKSLLITLVGDHRDPRLEPVMRDALTIPDTGDDVAWEVRATALSHLEKAPFGQFLDDYDLILRKVAEWRARP